LEVKGDGLDIPERNSVEGMETLHPFASVARSYKVQRTSEGEGLCRRTDIAAERTRGTR
jgi:hypothetical protein